MKVGLSFSRCVRDIVDGVVDIDDVLVIIARTKFDPRNDKHWEEIWNGYHDGIWSRPEWVKYTQDQEAEFRRVALELWNTGKLHQPRIYGHYVGRSPGVWLDVVGQKEND
jgi:hypothetical protein